jgi:hypothetical protein
MGSQCPGAASALHDPTMGMVPVEPAAPPALLVPAAPPIPLLPPAPPAALEPADPVAAVPPPPPVPDTTVEPLPSCMFAAPEAPLASSVPAAPCTSGDGFAPHPRSISPSTTKKVRHGRQLRESMISSYRSRAAHRFSFKTFCYILMG